MVEDKTAPFKEVQTFLDLRAARGSRVGLAVREEPAGVIFGERSLEMM